MASKTSGGTKAFQPDSDVHVTFEDQQKINQFAKHNARLEELLIEVEAKKNSLKNIEEAESEIELFDDDEMIPFLFGEVFISNNLSETQRLLAIEKEKKQNELKAIQKKLGDIQQIQSELKAQLYHRFGNNISLETD